MASKHIVKEKPTAQNKQLCLDQVVCNKMDDPALDDADQVIGR